VTASYVAYGLQLAANMALPGLPVRRNSETVDVRIQLKDAWPFPGTLPAFGEGFYSSSDGAPASQPNLQVGLSSNGEHFGFFYGDGARFAVDRHGRDVRADWPEDYTLEDACTYLLGPVMGFVLRLRGTVCLHASAVAINDRAIALVGSPGSVREQLERGLDRLGGNYFVGVFAFGNLGERESLHSLDLFANEVVPHVNKAIA